jgi:capsular polysaccharide biosynthesis protein
MDRLRARWLLALALVAAGVGVGVLGAFVYSLTENKVYRARTALIAQVGTRPVTGGVLRTIRNLVATDIVAQNVIRNQNLTETSAQFDKRLHVSTAGSVITVDVDGSSQDEAVKLAQELSLVFTQLVRDRFGSGPDAAAVTIFDPAHGVGKVSPRVGRELGWGALFGGLLGLLVANVLVLRGRPGVWAPAPYAYEAPALDAASPRALAAAEQPESLGTDDDEIAAALIERSLDDPFQTVLVAGDEEGTVTAGIAQALADRGELTMWLQAAHADPDELDRLAAHCAYVLVAAPSLELDVARSLDAVVAVTDGSPLPHLPGVRVVGTVIR